MKNLLFLFLLLPTLAFSQGAIKRFGPIVVSGTSGGGGGGITIPVNDTVEEVAFAPIMNAYWNAIRPNQIVNNITTDCTFYENNVPVGATGTVTFVITSTIPDPIQVNGTVITPMPTTAGTYNRPFFNSGSGVTWP